MKRIFYILITLVTAFASSCQKENVVNTIPSDLTGEWHLTSTEVDGMVIDTLHDIFITFYTDCRFEIYQKSGDQTRYTRFCGNCKVSGNKLSGIYESGDDWGSKYSYSVSGETLTLITEDGMEIQTYKKEGLDQTSKDNADISSKAYSNGITPFL